MAEVLLRIRTDAAGAVQAITQVTDALQAETLAVQRQSAALSQASLTSATAQAALSDLNNARSLGVIGVRDYERQLGKLVASEAAATAAALESANAASRQAAEVEALRMRYDPAAAAAARLKVEQADIQRALTSGAISQERYSKLMAEHSKLTNQAAVSSGQLAQANRMLPAQFTDIFTSLAGGQNPMLVAIQQGGQIRDSYGGIGLALRSMGAALTSTLGLLATGAAAVAAFSYAAYQGAKEHDDFTRALVFTGNQAGKTADQLQDSAKRVSQSVGTQAQAAEVLVGLVNAGVGAGAVNLEALTAAALRLERNGGPAVQETIKLFKALAEDPVAALKKLSKETGQVSPAVYANVVALVKQGETARASALALQEASRITEAQNKALIPTLGLLERAWLRVKDASAAAMNAAMDYGRPDTAADIEQKLTARLEQKKKELGLYLPDSKSAGIYRKDIASIEASLETLRKRTQQKNAAAVAAKNLTESNRKAVQAEDDWRQVTEQNLTVQQQFAKERDRIERVGLAKGASQQQINDQVALARRRMLGGQEDSLAQQSAQFQMGLRKLADQDMLASIKGRVALQVLTEEDGIRAVADIEVKAAKDRAVQLDALARKEVDPAKRQKTQQDAALARKEALTIEAQAERDLLNVAEQRSIAYRKELEESLKSEVAKQAAYEDESAALQELIAIERAHGISIHGVTTLIARRTVERQNDKTAVQIRLLQDKLALAQSEQERRSIQATIDALRQLQEERTKTLQKAEQKDQDTASLELAKRLNEVELERTKSIAEERKRGWEETDRLAREVFVSWGTEGSNAAKKIGDSLRTALLSAIYEATLKPLTLQLYTSVTGSPSSIASNLLGGNTSSLLGNFTSLGSAFGGSFASGFQLALNGGTGMAFEGGAAMLSSATGASSAFAGLGQLAGAAAPWVAGALLLNEAISGLNGGKEYTTGTGITGTFSGSNFTGRNYQDWRNDGDKIFGMSVGRSSSGTNYSALDSELQRAMGAAFGSMLTQTAGFAKTLGASADAVMGYSEDIKLALGGDAAANKAAIEGLLKGVAARAAASVVEAQYIRSGETASDTLARLATSLATVNGLFDALDKTLLVASQSNADAGSKLIDLMGGSQAFASSMSSYYQAFYSEEERLAKTREQTTKAFADLSLAMPDTLAGFRDLVNAQDVSTEAGRKTFASLIGLSTAFKSITSTVDALQVSSVDAAKSIKTLTDSLSSERTNVARAASGINPTPVMTAAQIAAGIAGAKVSSPQLGAVSAATASAAAATAAASAAQTALGTSSQALSKAQSDKTGLVNYYAAKNAELRALGAAYSPSGTSIRFNATGENNDAYNYNAANNRLNDFNYIGYTRYTNTYSIVGIKTAETTYMPDVAGMKADPKYAALNKILGSGNAELAKAAQTIATAQNAFNSASATAATATQAQAAAAAALLDRQTEYNNAVKAYTVDAAKSVGTLGKLREETVRYYESQKALSELMLTSATNLRAAVATARGGQLSSAQSLAQQQGAFGSAYSMALSTSGALQASYADKLTAALPGLNTALADTAATRSDWAVATAQLFAQSESIAKLLEANAPKDYQAESLAMLTSIDTLLGDIGDATQVITNAIKGGAGLTAAGLREVVTALGGTPAFASGGTHSGGLRLVGENGPELEVTGPSRIFNASQTRAILGGGAGGNTARLEALVQKQSEQLEAMRYELRAIATSSAQTANTLKRVTPDGNSLQTVAAA